MTTFTPVGTIISPVINHVVTKVHIATTAWILVILVNMRVINTCISAIMMR